MAIARKIIPSSVPLAYAYGLPDWSNLAVIEQWRSNSAVSENNDYYDENNKLVSTKKTIKQNTDGTAAWNTVDDCIDNKSTGQNYGNTTYIYRAVAPCYIGMFGTTPNGSSNQDVIMFVGKSIAALRSDANHLGRAYSEDRAIMCANVQGSYAATWLIPIVPKTDNFYFRFCAISAYYTEIVIVPILGSGLTGKQCYRNTGTRGLGTLTYKNGNLNYLSNVIRDL